jgi:hypothetical protein
MDISSLLSQTNLVSITFFFITIVLIGYEFVLFTKDKKKKSKPVIPGFSSTKSAPMKSSAVKIQPPHAFKKNSLSIRRNVIGGIAGLVILATTGLIVYLTVQNNNKSALPPINSQAQTTDEQTELLNLGAQEVATLEAQPETDTESSTSGNLATESVATPSPTLAPTDAVVEATDESTLAQATDEAETTMIDDTDLDTTEVIVASADPTPTPITTLPLSSTYQYFFTAIGAAATILIVSLVI